MCNHGGIITLDFDRCECGELHFKCELCDKVLSTCPVHLDGARQHLQGLLDGDHLEALALLTEALGDTNRRRNYLAS